MMSAYCQLVLSSIYLDSDIVLRENVLLLFDLCELVTFWNILNWNTINFRRIIVCISLSTHLSFEIHSW